MVKHLLITLALGLLALAPLPAATAAEPSVATRPSGLAAAALPAAVAPSATAESAEKKTVRELFVPFDELNLILEGQPERVLMSRQEFLDLQARARKVAETRPPVAALPASAEYRAVLSQDRAEIFGEIVINVLADGLQMIGLDLSGVSLRSATLDGTRGAAIGQDENGRLVLFVEGRGQHKLTLEMVARLQTTAARQMLTFQLPTAPSARMVMIVPGDVEIKSGAAVISRRYDLPPSGETRAFDSEKNQTRFTLVPPRGPTTLVMTLNSHLKRRERLVVARNVLIDEVTQAYERLHARVSMAVLHMAVDKFRFAVPAGFEVTGVNSPLLSRWAMAAEDGRKVLEVYLREETTGTVVLELSAIRPTPDLANWRFPKFEPLDVVGQVSVVGLLVEDRLKAESLAPQGLIPINLDILNQALPRSLLENGPSPGAAAADFVARWAGPRLRPVAAYYAPQPRFELAARFVRPPAGLLVTTNLLLTLQDSGLRVRGGFVLLPQEEKLFTFNFTVPAGWVVAAVTDEADQPVPFERYDGRDVSKAGRAADDKVSGAEDKAGGPANDAAPSPAASLTGTRILIRLPAGAPAGKEKRIYFTAGHVPATWLENWPSTELRFPVFAVTEASRDVGAVAVAAQDDLTVREQLVGQHLTPLDENEMARYGLAEAGAALAYYYDDRPWDLAVAVERTQPRLTARTYSFFRLEREALAAHYEIAYTVDRARARRLSFLLPAGTPGEVAITGLDGVSIKESTSEIIGTQRRWTALLAEPLRGTVRLAIDYQQRLSAQEMAAQTLPLVQADGVAYQSGLAAVEGSSELDVQVATDLRRVDVGELALAQYQPGRRLLGAYSVADQQKPLQVTVARPKGYGLPPAIVQRAELATALSASGISQNAARFLLRTKALYLEVKLPPQAVFWSATLNGRPTKPQRDGDSLLLSLPAREGRAGSVAGESAANAAGSASSSPAPADETLNDLLIVYQAPAPHLGFWRHVAIPAPRLWLHGGPAGGLGEVPLADLVWNLYLPDGYKVIRSGGTVVTTDVPAPPLAMAAVAGGLYSAAGGVGLDRGLVGLAGLGAASVDISKSRAMVDWSREVKRGDEVTYEEAAPVARTPALAAEKPARMFGGIAAGSADKVAENPQDEEARKSDLAKESLEQSRKAEAVARGKMVADPAAEPVASRDRRSTVAGSGRPVSGWALQGLATLAIELQPAGPATTFRSLGSNPELGLTIVSSQRLLALTWALALAALLVGVANTNRSVRHKTAYLVIVALAATVLPVISGHIEWALVLNGTFYAACLLIPWYLLAGLARRLISKLASLGVTVPLAALLPSPGGKPGGLATGGKLPILFAGLGLLGLLALMAATVQAADAPAPSRGAAAAADRAAGGAEKPSGRPYVIQIVEPPPPVKVPGDALIVPYEAAKDGRPGPATADQLLVPYEQFVTLWNLANPDQKLTAVAPPARFALSGATFRATLGDGDYQTVEGQIGIDVYVDTMVAVAVPLEGGVLTRAELDGRPAWLMTRPVAAPAGQLSNVPGPQQSPPAQQERQQAGQSSQQASPVQQVEIPAAGVAVVYVSGQGRHQLDVTIRMKLERRGGWRIMAGRLPTAPATALVLKVPAAGTEVRLGGVNDRQSYETKAPGEEIRTAPSSGERIGVQWRPKVSEGQVDQGLTADSKALLDVQEDSLRLVWAVELTFRRSEREFFAVEVPAGYIVQRVEGDNVRGWELKSADNQAAPAGAGQVNGGPVLAGQAAGGPQTVEVSLLKRAKESESFTLYLWRSGPVGSPELREFAVPQVNVPSAIRHAGQITIRRSPLLDLRTVTAEGVTRTDLPSAGWWPGQAAGRSAVVRAANAPRPAADQNVARSSEPASAAAATGGTVADESPWGLRPYQSYLFAALPFKILLAAEPVVSRQTARVQTILKITDREQTFECRAVVTAAERPIYQVRLVVPAALRIEKVEAPGQFEWSSLPQPGQPERQVIEVRLAAGQLGEVPVIVRGPLGPQQKVTTLALPRVEVLGVERQEGDLVVQASPSLKVNARELRNLEAVPPARSWLDARQRQLAALGFHYTTADYAARLEVETRRSEVSARTVTNLRVTDRAIEETILVDLKIANAGIRQVSLLVPAWLKEARVSVAMLRQKKVEAVTAGPHAGWVRISLELQDEVMNQLQVLIENDRALTADGATVGDPARAKGQPAAAAGGREVAIPVIENYRTDNRYVAVESSGRDEVLVTASDGLEPLDRRQSDWQLLEKLLRGGMTQGYHVRGDATSPRLVFEIKRRTAVETAGARIGLAQTLLVMDASGAYRAQQVYHVDNQTEQFLEIALPVGARLWTAHVAGEAVKPVDPQDAQRPGRVLVPLVKTAVGDLNYLVVLKYAGQMPPLGRTRRVSFPLIRTLNVNVELSQVRLLLPEGYDWTNFDGTMRQVATRGTLEAGVLNYYNKELTRNLGAMKFETNAFVQTRARVNSEVLRKEAQNFTWSNSITFGDNADFANEQKLNERLMEQVKTEAETLDKSRSQVGGELGNRKVLGLDFDVNQSQLLRPQSVMKQSGDNFAELDADRAGQSGDGEKSGVQPQPQPAAGAFKDSWLSENDLRQAPDADGKEGLSAASGGKRSMSYVRRQEEGKPQSKGERQPPAGQSSDEWRRLSGQQAAGPQAGPQQQGQAATSWRYQKNKAGGEQLDDQGQQYQYQKQLEANQRNYRQNDLMQRRLNGLTGNGTEYDLREPAEGGRSGLGDTGVGVTTSGVELSGRLNVVTGHGGAGTAGGEGGALDALSSTPATVSFYQYQAKAPATGLGSLDIELPVRGQEFQFTTPRGEIEISARAVSGELWAALKRIATVVVMVLVVVWVVSLAARRRRQTDGGAGPFVGSTAATALIFLGALGLLFGVLPVASLAAMIVGLVAKIRQARSRRRRAAAQF